jgi:heme O synthase-like polyprenyltransferase
MKPTADAAADSSVPATTRWDATDAQPSHLLADFVTLAKPRLNLLVVFTTAAGLYLASPNGVALSVLLHTLIGTALIAGGAAALNQVWERDTDALMRRTRTRPIASGRLRPSQGLLFGLSLPALVLFGISFFWQMPHFLAIAWLYRDEYAAAGIPLLPVIEPDGRRTGRQALLYSAALWPVSLLPPLVGLAGGLYLVVATVLGLTLIALSANFARDRSTVAARRLFLFSITYLPLLWGTLVADRLWI